MGVPIPPEVATFFITYTVGGGGNLTNYTQACTLVQTCRRQLRHVAPWTRKTNRISEPTQWATQKYTIHYGNRRRPRSIPGYRHIQKDGRLPRAQRVPETHAHQSLPTPEFHPPSNQQSVLSSLIHRAKALCDQDSLAQNWNSSPPS